MCGRSMLKITEGLEGWLIKENACPSSMRTRIQSPAPPKARCSGPKAHWQASLAKSTTLGLVGDLSPKGSTALKEKHLRLSSGLMYVHTCTPTHMCTHVCIVN